jgi:hypothetical protein
MTGNSYYIPSGLLVYCFVAWLLDAAKSSRVKKLGAVMIFDATLTTRFILVVSIIGFTLGAIYVGFAVDGGTLGVAIFSSLAVMGSFAFPSVISITKDGIQEHKWWGRSISIPWREALKIEYHKGPATTVIVRQDGKKIAHSGFHRDSETFRAQCLSHTGLKLVTSTF